jgi:hypothetical protein
VLLNEKAYPDYEAQVRLELGEDGLQVSDIGGGVTPSAANDIGA